MKVLTIKKLYQRAHLSIVQSSLSNSLKFTLKCFEMILFNYHFIALLARFFWYLFIYNSKALFRLLKNLVFLLLLFLIRTSMSGGYIWQFCLAF